MLTLVFTGCNMDFLDSSKGQSNSDISVADNSPSENIGSNECQKISAIESDDSEILTLISSNWSKWKASSISDYIFTYTTLGSCAGVAPNITVTIENGCVKNVFSEASGVSISLESLESGMTIDEIFLNMFNFAKLNPEIFSLTTGSPDEPPLFDAQFGYPKSYYVKKSTNECDDYEFRVWGFQ